MFKLFLDRSYSSDTNNLYSAAMKQGIPVQRVNYFSETPILQSQEKPIFYLDTFLMKKLFPHQKLIEPKLDWLTYISTQYTHRHINSIFLSELKTMTSSHFFKPAEDKWFKAGIYKDGTHVHDTIIEPETLQNELVLYSEIVGFEIEYRFFIANRKIYACCMYALYGKLAKQNNIWLENTEAQEQASFFVNYICENLSVELASALVLDVGRLRNSLKWAIVEANPAHASGLYFCDPEQVLEVLKKCGGY